MNAESPGERGKAMDLLPECWVYLKLHLLQDGEHGGWLADCWGSGDDCAVRLKDLIPTALGNTSANPYALSTSNIAEFSVQYDDDEVSFDYDESDINTGRYILTFSHELPDGSINWYIVAHP